MNSSTFDDGENDFSNSATSNKFSSPTHLSKTTKIAEEQLPICSICQGEFDPYNFTVLECSHVFHRECIQHWLTIQQKCPNCNRENVNAHHIMIERRNQDEDSTGNEGNMEVWGVSASSDEALPLALTAYDRELHASIKDSYESAALEAAFQKIRRALTQSQQYEKNRQCRWERIKYFIRFAGISALITALIALIFYLYWFYWLLIKPLYTMAIMLTYHYIVYYIVYYILVPKVVYIMANYRLLVR